MRKSSLDFLKALVEAPSPSGFEGPVRRIWKREVEGYADEIKVDLHGNTIASYNPNGEPRIMLAGHIDELGFMVVYINDEGYIHFSTIGGFDYTLIPGRKVRIHTKNGPVLGVIGRKAVHLMEDDERKKASKIHELWIDIGAEDKQETESVVSIGDPITYDSNFEELRNGKAISRAFDDKAGAFVVAEAMRIVADKRQRPRAALFSVATVQEEIGLRGATTSAYGVNPTVGIAVDVTHATDQPDVDKRRIGDVKIGGGPSISRGANINPVVFDLLVQIAEDKKIPYQLEGEPRGTGTDANAIQLARAGVAAGLVSVPLRYMHTPVELLAFKDAENCATLLAEFVMAVDSSTSFVPD